MARSLYPTCPKCNEGTLLPFYSENGENVYACTHCQIVFGPQHKQGKEKYQMLYFHATEETDDSVDDDFESLL